MFSRLETSSLVVSEVFAASRTYAVPAFQRPFAWTTSHVTRLFDDIAVAAGLDGDDVSEADYFLGTVILMRNGDAAAKAEPTASHDRLDIVDGQQRFITLTLILTSLRDHEDDPAQKKRLNDFIHAYANPAATAAPIGQEQFVPRLKLRPADQPVFEQHVQTQGQGASIEIDDLPAPAHRSLLDCRRAIDELVARLKPEERRVLTDYLLSRCHFVAILTDDLDKAHKLFSVINDTGIKLQRNQILKSEVLRATPPARAQALHDIWEQTELRLGQKFEELFSHIRSVHGLSRPQVIKAVRQIMDDVGGAVPFVDTALVPYAEAYEKILDPECAIGDMAPETVALLRQLRRLNGEDWVPAALIALQRAMKEPEVGHRALLRIDRLAHLLRLMCLGGGRRQTRFNRVTAALRKGEGFASDPHPAFNIPREELRLIAHHLRDLYGRSPHATKLVLMRADDDLTGSVSPLMTNEVSVEHVLPQRPKGASEWRDIFPDTERRQACTTSIGNLVLVTPRQNDRAKNAEFDAKKEIYATPGDGRSVMAITQQVIDQPAWDANCIQQREAAIVEAIQRIWQFDLPGWSKDGAA